MRSRFLVAIFPLAKLRYFFSVTRPTFIMHYVSIESQPSTSTWLAGWFGLICEVG
jgi:hypothetical protein